MAFIQDIFERRGGERYLGEAVTLAEHMLQGATIAERKGDPDEIVAAALLHDIGHIVGGAGSFFDGRYAGPAFTRGPGPGFSSPSFPGSSSIAAAFTWPPSVTSAPPTPAISIR